MHIFNEVRLDAVFNPILDIDPSDMYVQKKWNPMKKIGPQVGPM